MRHSRYIELAIELARSNPNIKWKHGAILVSAGRIMSFGQNTERPVTSWSFRNRHAEEDCFYKSNLNEIAGHLYVARVRLGDGQADNSRPCDCCLDFLLEKTRVRKVHYTTEGGSECLNLNQLRNS